MDQAGEIEPVFVPGALLDAIHQALLEHAQFEREPPYLVLLNPSNFELLGWDEVFGLFVLPDERVAPLCCRLVSGAYGWAGAVRGERVYWIDSSPHVEVDPDEKAA